MSKRAPRSNPVTAAIHAPNERDVIGRLTYKTYDDDEMIKQGYRDELLTKCALPRE